MIGAVPDDGSAGGTRIRVDSPGAFPDDSPPARDPSTPLLPLPGAIASPFAFADTPRARAARGSSPPGDGRARGHHDAPDHDGGPDRVRADSRPAHNAPLGRVGRLGAGDGRRIEPPAYRIGKGLRRVWPSSPSLSRASRATRSSATVDWGDGSAATTSILGFGPDAVDQARTPISSRRMSPTSSTALRPRRPQGRSQASVGDGVIAEIDVTQRPSMSRSLRSTGQGTALEGGTQTYAAGATATSNCPTSPGSTGSTRGSPSSGRTPTPRPRQYQITVTLSVGGNDVRTANGAATVVRRRDGRNRIGATRPSRTAILEEFRPPSCRSPADHRHPARRLFGRAGITAVIGSRQHLGDIGRR